MSDVPFFTSEKIADGSYMIRCGFVDMPLICYLVEGSECALLIDTMQGWGDLRAYCEKLTGKPIKVVNTHAHPDHVFGNFQFERCYMHYLDIAAFWECTIYNKEQIIEAARQSALPEYRDALEPDNNFFDAVPIPVIPICGGDVFDLGDRMIEVVEAGGHTPGSIVLIDPKTRIAYSGDACNGNTLLEFEDCLPVIEYMSSLLRLKKRQPDFDMMYGGHEVFDSSIIDEAIETVARVIAGTDDKCERTGLMGGPVLYAAAKVEGGYERVDGKRFNMSYDPKRITGVKLSGRVWK